MKKKWNIGKGFLYILHELSIVILALSLVGIVLVVDLSGGYMPRMASKYEESGQYQDQFYNKAVDILLYTVIRDQFETNGEFDGSKLINIEEYAKHIEAGKETQTYVYYMLEDLIKWGQVGVYYSDTMVSDTKEVSSTNHTYTPASVETPAKETPAIETPAIENAKKKIEEANAKVNIGNESEQVKNAVPGTASKEETTLIVEDQASAEVEAAEDQTTYLPEENYRQAGIMQESIVITDITEDAYAAVENTEEIVQEEVDAEEVDADEVMVLPVIEKYLPVDGKPLAEHMTGTVTRADLQEYLQETIDMIYINYDNYRYYQEEFAPNNSNMKYIIRINKNDTQYIYTNVTGLAEENVNDNIAKLKKIGDYEYYNSSNFNYEGSGLIGERELISIVNNYDYAYGDDYEIILSADTSYPVMDSFKNASDNFEVANTWYFQLLIVASASAIFLLILFVILTAKAGRNKKGEELQLLFIDNLHTEIFLIIAGLACFGAGACAVGIGGYLMYAFAGNTWQSQPELFLSGVAIAVAILNPIFLFFYLSLIRKIKGHLLWKNSLVYQIGAGIKSSILSVYNNGSIALRTLVPFTIFVVLNGILLTIYFDTYEFIIFILFIVFNVAVGIALYKFICGKMRIIKGIEKIKEGDLEHKIDVEGLYGDNRVLADAVNTIGDGIHNAVEASMKNERLKTDLITNVSHDIKTPLTSIINYVDLLRRENIQDEKVKGYLDVLDTKSQRLKQLTEDLVEASKISSGNISLVMTRINFVELINQTAGEFSAKFEEKNLQLIMNLPGEPVIIEADSRSIWRVIENLFNNVAKYAMENTRVYVELYEQTPAPKTVDEDMITGVGDVTVIKDTKEAVLMIKNVSAYPLNINADELTERFIRGDISRSTEGSGLGLSIAKSLTQRQNGDFSIYLDGDLFKVTLTFPCKESKKLLETEERDEAVSDFTEQDIIDNTVESLTERE